MAFLIPVGLLAIWWTLTPTPRDLAARLVASYLAAWALFRLLSRRPASFVLKRFALMTGAVLFTMILVEVPALLGLVDYGALFPANRIEPFLGRRDRPDPDLIRLHPPHLRETGWTQGDLVVSTNTRVSGAPWYRYDVRYDARGFRNETDLDRAEIAVIGDSFVEGVQVPFDDLLTTTLGRLRRSSVANLGQIGYGPREELHVLKRFALPLRPDVCVWCVFEGNDLSDLRHPDRTDRPGAEGRSLGDRSFLKNALLAAIRIGGVDRSRYDQLMARSGLFVRPDGDQLRMFFLYPGQAITDQDRLALKEFGRILGEARGLCRERGVRLVVVFMPTKFRVYGDLCRFAPGSPCLTWAMNELPEAIRSIVTWNSPESGFLDLTGPFREEAARGSVLYYPDDTHWSPEGHALAGRLLANYLAATEATEAQPALTPRTRPATSPGPSPAPSSP